MNSKFTKFDIYLHFTLHVFAYFPYFDTCLHNFGILFKFGHILFYMLAGICTTNIQIYARICISIKI